MCYYLPAAADMVKGLVSAFEVYVSILRQPRQCVKSIAYHSRRRYRDEPAEAVVACVSTPILRLLGWTRWESNPRPTTEHTTSYSNI